MLELGELMDVKLLKLLQVSILAAVLFAGFNNCSPPNVGTGEVHSSNTATKDTSSSLTLSSTGDICEDAIRETFVDGYYKFAKNNCATCHAVDADKPQFASPNPNWAYDTFIAKGYQKFSKNATSEAHQYPYTGLRHIETINELKSVWQKAMTNYNTCKGETILVDVVDPADLLNLQLVNKPIPALAVNAEAKITWDLNREVFSIKQGTPVPILPGAKLSILVVHRQTLGGEHYYALKAPMIFGSTVDTKIKTIYAKINDRLVTYASTFKYVDTSIRKGSNEDSTGLITTGSLPAPGVVSSNDRITLAFEKLESTIMPDAVQPLAVNITSPIFQLVSSTTDYVDINLGVVGNLSEAGLISIEEDSSAPTGCTLSSGKYTLSSTCLSGLNDVLNSNGMSAPEQKIVERARNVVGPTYRRFDWDYKFGVSAFSLKGTNPTTKMRITFSKDIRKEGNRILRLKLYTSSDNVTPGTNSDIYFVFRKYDNPVPVSGEWTYSKLMKTGGILANNCVRCHNSVDRRGDYEMTDYNEMITKQPYPVLIPGSLASRMYRRLNSADPEFTDSPMPKEGAPLSLDQVKAVEDWILRGAKNN